MARIDDYKKAAEISRGELKKRDPQRAALAGGAQMETKGEGGVVLSLDFLGQKVGITWPEMEITYGDSDREVPIQQQVLLLHYLSGAGDLQPTGEWIAYQEVPDGKFYLDAFLRRAKEPMLQTFGQRPELMVQLAEEIYGAEPLNLGDAAVVVRALPKVPVALILWKGDEEFPPEGNLLFDKSISQILSAEDIAWLAGMVVYPLIGKAGKA
jgi:hypothetical protein